MGYVSLTSIREDFQVGPARGYKDYQVTVTIEHNVTTCEHSPHDIEVRVYWNPIPWGEDKEITHKFYLTLHDGENYRTTIRWDGGEAVMQGDNHREIARRVFKYSKAMREGK